MTDLGDGESVTMQGSASRPYVLKNVGGVYSCSCPAWRNQSLPIERRTCKHLRNLRGDSAEETRLGNSLPVPAKEKERAVVPRLLLAETWNDDLDPQGWLLSEKLDGVRAYWTGTHFLSRGGNRYHAPAWFTAGLPQQPLDGELWIGRKQFQRTVSIVRRQDQTDLWREVRFVVFDAPATEGGFEARLQAVEQILRCTHSAYAQVLAHRICLGRAHLRAELNQMEALGGEGLMLRQPGSVYVVGRSTTLLKVKRFLDSEARVVGHEPGAGRHRGRLGALLVELANGTRFAVGTGLTDAERERPPAIGAYIRFRYQELSDGGVPRFPSYLGIRADTVLSINLTVKGAMVMSTTTSAKRRFEFVAGNSDKFWEIAVHGAEVTVRFGRNGTEGQTDVKMCADADAAARHATSKISEKLRKGYQEIA